ncbi:hypothetical protein ACFX2G_034977 [Malus domestica]
MKMKLWDREENHTTVRFGRGGEVIGKPSEVVVHRQSTRLPRVSSHVIEADGGSIDAKRLMRVVVSGCNCGCGYSSRKGIA